MSNNPPSWPHGAPPPGGGAPPSPFQPLRPPQGTPTPPVGAQPSNAGMPDAGYTDPGRFGPLGEPTPQRVSIDDFAPRRENRTGTVLAVVAALTVAAVIAAALLITRMPHTDPATSASPTPGASGSPSRTPNPNGQGVEFQSPSDHASGYWEIQQQSWQNDGVLLRLSITVDEGSLTPQFYVFNNDSNAQYRIVLADAPEPRFPSGELSGAKTYAGQVLVKMPRVDGTLIMLTGHQTDAVSALPIKK